MMTAAELKRRGQSGTYSRPASSKGAKQFNTADEDRVQVLMENPTTVARRWSGVSQDNTKIVYLRAADRATLDTYLVARGLLREIDDLDGPVLVPVGCMLDRLGPVQVTPAVFDGPPDKNGFPTLTAPAVMDTGYHVNVLIKT